MTKDFNMLLLDTNAEQLLKDMSVDKIRELYAVMKRQSLGCLLALLLCAV